MFKQWLSAWTKSDHQPGKYTILVIEDNPVDQKVAVRAIERGGYKSLVAQDGQSGLALAQSALPNLIILDYLLPDTSGPELCQLLKANALTKHIPVLFLTGLETPSSIVNCFDKGGDNYLSKPISPKILLKYIEDLIREKKNA